MDTARLLRWALRRPKRYVVTVGVSSAIAITCLYLYDETPEIERIENEMKKTVEESKTMAETCVSEKNDVDVLHRAFSGYYDNMDIKDDEELELKRRPIKSFFFNVR